MNDDLSRAVVTPLQLANAYATFANGGTLYQPRLAEDVTQSSAGLPQGQFGAPVTTFPANQLGSQVLPTVGWKYRTAEEQAILDEIRAALPSSSTVSCSRRIVAVGLNATRTRIDSPFEMPPCILV